MDAVSADLAAAAAAAPPPSPSTTSNMPSTEGKNVVFASGTSPAKTASAPPSSAPIDLAKVAVLLRHRHPDTDMSGRHLSALRKIQRRCAEGFALCNLSAVANIITALEPLATQSFDIYGEPLTQLTRLAVLPSAKAGAFEHVLPATAAGISALLKAIADLVSSETVGVVTVGLDAITTIAKTASKTASAASAAENLGSDDSNSSRKRSSKYRKEEEEEVSAEAARRHVLSTHDLEASPAIVSVVASRLQHAATAAVGSSSIWMTTPALQISLATASLKLSELPGLHSQFSSVEHGIATSCLALVARGASEQETVAVCMLQVLWNLLEGTEAVAVAMATQLATEKGASALVTTVRNTVLGCGASRARKQTRNDVIIVLMMLAKDERLMPLLAGAGLLQLLARYLAWAPAASKHAHAHHPDTRGLHLSNVREDFEFEKALLCTIADAVWWEPAAAAAVAQTRFLEHVLQYLDPELGEPRDASPTHARHPRNWTRAQFEELQLLAVHQLSAVAPAVMERFTELRGSARLLKLLLWSLEQDPDGSGLATRSFRGAGNALHSTADFSTGVFDVLSRTRTPNNGRRSHALVALQALAAVARGGSTRSVMQDLVDQGLLDVLIGFLERPLVPQPDEMELSLRVEALLLLSTLCDGVPHAQELAGSRAVHMLMKLAPRDGSRLGERIGYEELFVSAYDALWSIVIGCGLNERVLIDNSGVFALLDTLEAVPRHLQAQVLGLVLDLAENPAALRHIPVWRSAAGGGSTLSNASILSPSVTATTTTKFSMTATATTTAFATASSSGNTSAVATTAATAAATGIGHLLMSLWRQECAVLNCAIGPGGALSNVRLPLAGAERQSALVEPRPAGAMSEAIADVSSNMRAKVHCLCALLGWELLESEFEASPADLVTLVAVREYCSLKAGEVWAELEDELTLEGVEPTAYDADFLRLARRANEGVVSRVITGQQAVLELANGASRADEARWTETWRAQSRTVEKAKADFAQFLRRTADFEQLKQAKAEQRRKIEESRLLIGNSTSIGGSGSGSGSGSSSGIGSGNDSAAEVAGAAGGNHPALSSPVATSAA